MLPGVCRCSSSARSTAPCMPFVPAVSTFYISQKLGSTSDVLIGDIIERQFKSAQNPYLGAAMSLILMILVFISIGLMNKFTGDEEVTTI